MRLGSNQSTSEADTAIFGEGRIYSPLLLLTRFVWLKMADQPGVEPELPLRGRPLLSR